MGESTISPHCSPPTISGLPPIGGPSTRCTAGTARTAFNTASASVT